MPQYAIAHVGSSLIACSNDRIAAPWLKPYRNLMPWTAYFSASGLAAVTFRPVVPSPSYNGSSARSDEAKRPTPRTTTASRMIAFMGSPICISDTRSVTCYAWSFVVEVYFWSTSTFRDARGTQRHQLQGTS